jgi:hypothetical protein
MQDPTFGNGKFKYCVALLFKSQVHTRVTKEQLVTAVRPTSDKRNIKVMSLIIGLVLSKILPNAGYGIKVTYLYLT